MRNGCEVDGYEEDEEAEEDVTFEFEVMAFLVRVELDENACAMTVAPVSPIPLQFRFNSVRVDCGVVTCEAAELIREIFFKFVFCYHLFESEV